MNLSDPQACKEHQGIDRIVPEAEHSGAVDSGKEAFDLFFGERQGALAVSLPDFEDVLEGKHLRVRDIHEAQMLGIAAEREDLPVDGAASVFALSFEVILEIHDCRAIDYVIPASVDKILEKVEVDPVASDRLFAGLVDGAAVIEEAVQVIEESLCCYRHVPPPKMATSARACFFMPSGTWTYTAVSALRV